MALPATVGLFAFVLAPTALTLWLSVHAWNGLGTPVFTGIANFTALLGDPGFTSSAALTGALCAVVVPADLALALLVGHLVSRVRSGGTLALCLLVLPWLAAPVATGVLWRWILAPTGGLVASLTGERLPWLAQPVPAFLCLAFVTVWSTFGQLALLFSAGLAAQPVEVIEAAALDGAGPLRSFLYVRLPLLRPLVLFAALVTAAQTLTAYDSATVLTGGGPDGATDIFAVRLFADAFTSFDIGSAAAMSVLALLVFVSAAMLLGRGRQAGGEGIRS